MSKYEIEMNDITKIYGNLYANNKITLKVKKGEIHGIIGENGAGKSTLMSILFGLVKPTTGYILINGKEYNIQNALDAERLGIGMVHQHFKLIDIFNAVQNIILGREKRNRLGFIDYLGAKKEIKALIDKYKFNINLDVPIDQLNVGQQQKIEILKLLYRNSEILIFDEPTGVLTPQEIDEFLKLLLYFKKIGKTVILISHKLNEIKSVCDTATVIRKGKVIKEINVKKTSINKMSSLMVGTNLKTVKNNSNLKKDAKVLFEVKNIYRKATQSSMKLQNINFKIKEGEILAIAGVEGNGQTELINIITGLEQYSKKQKMKYESSIKLDGQEILNVSIKERFEAGLSHIPEDRHKYGLILNSELKNSLFLQEYNKKPFAKNGFLVNKAINEWTKKLIKSFDIRGANNGESLASSLSGGNQQKAILAREITRKNKVIIIAQPTRGLDVGAINNVHEAILNEKKKGKAILLISYELPEIFALADRILVISSGIISKELLPKNTSFKEIGILMGGKNTNSNKSILKYSNNTKSKKSILKKQKKCPQKYIIEKSYIHKGWIFKKVGNKKPTYIAKTKKEVESYYVNALKSAVNSKLIEKTTTGKIQKITKKAKPKKLVTPKRSKKAKPKKLVTPKSSKKVKTKKHVSTKVVKKVKTKKSINKGRK